MWYDFPSNKLHLIHQVVWLIQIIIRPTWRIDIHDALSNDIFISTIIQTIPHYSDHCGIARIKQKHVFPIYVFAVVFFATDSDMNAAYA